MSEGIFIFLRELAQRWSLRETELFYLFLSLFEKTTGVNAIFCLSQQVFSLSKDSEVAYTPLPCL